MEKKELGVNEEIVLAPEETANMGAVVDLNTQKQAFVIYYTPVYKETILSELERMECVVEGQSHTANTIVVFLTKEQLVAVKSMDGIEQICLDNYKGELVEVPESLLITEDTVQCADNFEPAITMNVAAASCELSDMATAVTLSYDVWSNGKINCIGEEVWFKFTVSCSGWHTLHTRGSLDTIGYLYDACGEQLDSDDDKGDGLNFRMVEYLMAGQTYYIKVKAFGTGTGSFAITVTQTVYVESVTVNPAMVTMVKGTQRKLSATVQPSYATEKGVLWRSTNESVVTIGATGRMTARGIGTAYVLATAQDGSENISCCFVTVTPYVPITGLTIDSNNRVMMIGESSQLTATACPSNASDQTLVWCSSDPSVVSVDPYTGSICANGICEVRITVSTEDGYYCDSITIRVIIDTVTIMKDDMSSNVVFNKVIFNSTGKEWHCINYDMLFNEQYADNSILKERAAANYGTRTGNSITVHTYSDEEIQLLYAIDPYGVAKYINDYLLFSRNNEGIVTEKDRIFTLLFKREPSYFKRNYDGAWVKTNEEFDYETMLSESECLFGFHPIYDEVILARLIEFAVDIAVIILDKFGIDHRVNILADVVKSFFLLRLTGNLEVEDLVIDVATGEADEKKLFKFEETPINILNNWITVYQNLESLAESIVVKNDFSNDALQYYVNEGNYDIHLKLHNGTICKVKDIDAAVRGM